MKYRLLSVSLLGFMLGVLSGYASAESADVSSVAAIKPDAVSELHFSIKQYEIEGATLLSVVELSEVLAPYVGEGKQFLDVQSALQAVEKAYAQKGYTAVHVVLPEQQLEQGTVRLRVIESRFAEVNVKDNRYVSAENVLHALPSVRTGNAPSSKQIARELNLANENPARQLNVVLKGNDQEGKVDANVVVTDTKPSSWNMTLDNTGTPETGRTRAALSYRYANMFDTDQVANLQYVTSPEFSKRVEVVGGGYKIPLYESGNSLEFFAGYSNVNSVVGGLSNFTGGGRLLSSRYNVSMEPIGGLQHSLFFGVDWRDFKRIELTTQTPTVMYNEIVVTPLSIGYAAQGKFDRRDFAVNLSLEGNIPSMSKGGSADFAAYDKLNLTQPNAAFKVLRYSGNYAQVFGEGWQFRTALAGQWSPDVLVQGEQIRLGGAAAVRGFTEGSESGESGTRGTIEGYTPDYGIGDLKYRGLMFFDAGVVKPAQLKGYSISSAGLGVRANFTEQVSLYIDVASILNSGADAVQRRGDRRVDAGLSANF